jgi:uncharacterized protein YsxB (DUF464 family)
MTKVVFYKSSNTFWGFEEVAHSGLAEEGKDILCASISAMTMLVINAIEEVYKSKIQYEVDEESTVIRVKARGALPKHETDEKKRYAISGLLEAYYRQLGLLQEEFPKNLRVSVVERDVDDSF